MKTVSLFIFRHGQTKHNEQGRFTGWLNSSLTKKGIEDAKIIALRLKDKHIHTAVQTKLSRSQATLKQVLKFHPECKMVITDDRMIERNYGSLSGKSHWEIVQKHGFDKYDAWHRSYSTRPPKGESFADVESRVKPFFADMIRLAKELEGNVAISAHGNSIRVLRRLMEKASEKETCSWFIPYDNYYEYKITV